MKTKHAILAALIAGAMTLSAQAQTFYPVITTYTDAQKERLDQNFAASMDTEYDGLTESALAIITKVKLDAPANEYPAVKTKIGELATEGATAVIRYKAFLAEAVFANPEVFRDEALGSYATEDALFNALAGKMSKTLLSSN